MAEMILATDGAERHASALTSDELATLARLGDSIGEGTAGERLFGHPDVAVLTQAGSTFHGIAALTLGPHAKAVRAVLFDKSAANNWPLGWHQDRVIAVKKRAEVVGFGPFTVKQGILHVQPPADVIGSMVTLRAHLDPVDADNAPLLIARGSHRLGLVPVDEVPSVVDRSELAACLADPGDVWAYHTLILHASEAARHPRRRRVLQVDFAAHALPAPLEWLGV